MKKQVTESAAEVRARVQQAPGKHTYRQIIPSDSGHDDVFTMHTHPLLKGKEHLVFSPVSFAGPSHERCTSADAVVSWLPRRFKRHNFEEPVR